MKFALQYVNDTAGRTTAVQLSVTEWEKVLHKLEKYEQAFRLKSDIKEALAEVATLKKSHGRKQSLTDFLDEL
jgi:uncharacterized membrane protein YvbJ